MPVNIPDNLPAKRTLEEENIFVMTDLRANHQDIRPLRIAVLNLMPTKITTESQLLRLLGNSPLQVHISLIRMGSHDSRNTPAEHLESFYETIDEVLHKRFDGLIITGAPVETLSFEDVDYWDELKKLMDWSLTNVYSTLHICWGAQAGLYYHYGVPKYQVSEKIFGVFPHKVLDPNERLLRGFDEEFFAPHSRYTEVLEKDILKHKELKLLATSAEAGVYMVSSVDGRQVFVTGHPEYDKLTLKGEYDRDVAKGLAIKVPAHYYPDDDPRREPIVRWRSHAHLLYANWLNYFVYQETPFNLEGIKPIAN